MIRRDVEHSFFVLAVIIVIFLGACSRGEERAASREEGKTMAIELTSPAFTEGAAIPQKYTCDAEDLSPPLKWGGLPEGTQSLAIICDDPDAPMRTWVHWVIYDIPASVTELDEGVPKTDVIPKGAKQGVTDFKKTGYGGPCPPPGKAHRYFFKIYALDAQLNLEPRAKKKDVLKAMEGHVLGEGELMGTYKR
jgi:Raf kinase inhibitor-like YbhB/YbcL family protein